MHRRPFRAGRACGGRGAPDVPEHFQHSARFARPDRLLRRRPPSIDSTRPPADLLSSVGEGGSIFMAETEELKLVVSLDDQASPGLVKLYERVQSCDSSLQSFSETM
jgi:hypothetical protein